MPDFNFTLLQKIILYAIPLLFAITVHETAHGWLANKLGDPTAKMLGRLTLNPIKHIDPIGTILLPVILVITTGFLFGWAKPVPVTWENLKHPRRDMALVALAGPLSNLLMAIAWGLIAKISLLMPLYIQEPLSYMSIVGIFFNIMLMVLNLIPIPPLDGSRILAAFLRGKAAYHYASLERYGFIILVVLLMLGVLSKFMLPIVGQMVHFIASAFGLAI